MKYLVLGSSGQIGLELSVFLKNKGHHVIEFDIAKNLEEDLRIRDVLETILPEIDFVMFLSFDVGGSTYLKKYQNTYDFIHNNTLINAFTFEMLEKHKKPFIYTSSQMANMSYSPYGVCKSLGEIYTKSLNGLTVKFWNVYGIENNLEKSHVITDFILKAKEGKISMMTDGKEQRQFLHAEDCANALYILSQEYDNIDREKNLHITSFEWNSIIEVAEIISNEIPCLIEASHEIDTIQLDKRNEPDPYILNFWKPQIPLYEGIKKIINNMK